MTRPSWVIIMQLRGAYPFPMSDLLSYCNWDRYRIKSSFLSSFLSFFLFHISIRPCFVPLLFNRSFPGLFISHEISLALPHPILDLTSTFRPALCEKRESISYKTTSKISSCRECPTLSKMLVWTSRTKSCGAVA